MLAQLLGVAVVVLLFSEQVRLTGLHASILDPSLLSTARSTWWYKYSSFSYSAAGAYILASLDRLRAHSAFPWRAFGWALVLNGWTSFRADVVTLGKYTRIKTVDVLLASSNFVAAGLATASMRETTPVHVVRVWYVGLLAAIVSKNFASKATMRDDVDAFMRYHVLWHVSLPLLGMVGIRALPLVAHSV